MQHFYIPKWHDQPREHSSHFHSQPCLGREQLKWSLRAPQHREQSGGVESWLSYYRRFDGYILGNEQLWPRGDSLCYLCFFAEVFEMWVKNQPGAVDAMRGR